MEKFRDKYRIPSSRLQNWDYGWNAPCFVTICTAKMDCYFGEIANRKMQLSDIGKIAQKFWLEIPNHFPFVILDAFVVMPNHVHGIIIIDKLDDEFGGGGGRDGDGCRGSGGRDSGGGIRDSGGGDGGGGRDDSGGGRESGGGNRAGRREKTDERKMDGADGTDRTDYAEGIAGMENATDVGGMDKTDVGGMDATDAGGIVETPNLGVSTVHHTGPTVHPTGPTVHHTGQNVNPTGSTVNPTDHPTGHTDHCTSKPTKPTGPSNQPTNPSTHSTGSTSNPTNPTIQPNDQSTPPTNHSIHKNPKNEKSGQIQKKSGGKNPKWKPGTLGVIINQYKRICTINARKIITCFTWQSRFHDHVIQNDKSYQRIKNYIINNPRNWEDDMFFK